MITATPISTLQNSGTLSVHLLGTVDYLAAMALQRQMVVEIADRQDHSGKLLICEHPPTLTVGCEGSRRQFLVDDDELQANLIDVHWVNRGGGCLLHAPGQLAVYPILPLKRIGLGMSRYHRLLEQVVSQVCAEFKTPTHAPKDQKGNRQPGLCVRNGQFAFVGTAVQSWVSHHGLFVNICPDLHLQRFIANPQPHTPVTSLAASRHRKTSMHAVRESLVRHLAHQLGYERYHLHTGHPQLIRTRKKVLLHA